MRCRFPGLVVLLLLASATPAIGQEPIVRITVTPEEVPVGEPVALQITVLVPTWFPKPLVYPDYELSNTITRLPPNSSRPTTERFGRDSWAGIVRTYQIYPLIGATFSLTGQTITVTYVDPENYKPVTIEVDVPEIEFRARVPVGAEGLDPYVAGRRLTMNREFEGDLESLEVGDALVARYTAELDGMPVIFLPALVKVPEARGVSVYAEEPVVEDGAPARRSEKLTLVFEAGGDFTIPAAEIRWWNTETSAVEIASVPTMTVSVAGPPIPVPVDEEPPPKPMWPTVLTWTAFFAAALWALRRWAPLLRSSWAAYQERRRRSEEYGFKQLRRALHGGDPRAAHRALLAWFEKLEPGADARQFAQRYGGEELERRIDELSRSLYGDGGEVNLRGLEKPLSTARHRRLRGNTLSSTFVLPPMNP